MARQSSPIHQLSQQTIGADGDDQELNGIDSRVPHTPPQSSLGPESLRMSFRLIQHLLSDPADEVFIAALVRNWRLFLLFTIESRLRSDSLVSDSLAALIFS